MTNIYGLIGKKLEHSFSPDYFSRKFRKLNLDADYRLFEMDNISKLPEIIQENKNIRGLNVTIPYKKEVLQFLDKVDNVAQEIGSVNTVKIDRIKGKTQLSGYNTDVVGFEISLKTISSLKNIQKALILGTGGSAEAVSYVLGKLQIEYLFVSRNPVKANQISYHDLDQNRISDCQLIVNATPVGMYPETENQPDIPYKHLTNKHLLFDLIYNPSETGFLTSGKKQGASIKPGLEMLHIQAEEAWNIWQS